MRLLSRLVLGASVVGLAACYPAPPPDAMYVRVAPPAYRAEVMGVAPGPGYFWIGGYWEWGGAEYRWVPGSWVVRPHPGAGWIRGHWRGTRRGYYWIPGHWR